MKRTDGRNRRCVIDVTLAVNGIPVVTAELKNPLTGQCAADAVRQYQDDRDRARSPLRLQEARPCPLRGGPGRSMDNNPLKGKETHFLPFNRGNNHGAGNPPVEGNWKTHYLWDEVLQADSLLEILQRFMHLEKEKKQFRTNKGTRTQQKERMIFPRYHQLDAGRRLVDHAKAHGAAELPDPALGRFRQVQLHCMACPPAGQPP